jgi:uncharacterized membrane protein YfcA
MDIELHVIVLLTLMCVVSGFIDAIAGGGGLITVPGMLFAGIPPINVLATNKLQSVMGTSMAAWNYWRNGHIDWKRNRLAVAVIVVTSALGALAVQMIDTDILRLIVPVLLVAVAGYVLLSPRMSDEDAHHRVSSNGYAPIGGAIGFYDGFFGPGTGAFFSTSLVAFRGYGLTKATALTKLFNLSSNFGSVLLFALGGKMMWVLGFCMAAGSITGGWLGSHTAMRFGAKIIRPLLVAISLTLTGKLIWDYFAG